MKLLVGLLLIITISGCKLKSYDPIDNGAIKFSGVFISENIQADPNLRVKGISNVKGLGDSIYHVTGLVEGFSPMNYPVSFEHFSEILRYLGGDPNDRKNWDCLEIYIQRKRFK